MIPTLFLVLVAVAVAITVWQARRIDALRDLFWQMDANHEALIKDAKAFSNEAKAFADHVQVANALGIAALERAWWGLFTMQWGMIGREMLIDCVGLGSDMPDWVTNRSVCAGCLNEIDLDTCHCGAATTDHHSEHGPVSMGCTCYLLPHDPRELARHWKSQYAGAIARLRVDFIVSINDPDLEKALADTEHEELFGRAN